MYKCQLLYLLISLFELRDTEMHFWNEPTAKNIIKEVEVILNTHNKNLSFVTPHIKKYFVKSDLYMKKVLIIWFEYLEILNIDIQI